MGSRLNQPARRPEAERISHEDHNESDGRPERHAGFLAVGHLRSDLIQPMLGNANAVTKIEVNTRMAKIASKIGNPSKGRLIPKL